MLPEAFAARMKEMLGSEYEAFLAQYEEENHQSLRLNPMKKQEGIQDALFVVNKYFTLEQVPWEPNGFYYPKEQRPGKHALHDAGVYYIQEASAMLPVRLLAPKPGDYVLDLCAAPGGKSTQIGGLLEGAGLLVSNEIHPARAKILSENIERLGIPNAVVTNEKPETLVTHFPGFFDKILVDAPCSGEGMFRKNCEAEEEWSEDNVALCAERQKGILACAADMLRPGGKMVYSTCTFAPAENEENIAWFLENYPQFHRVEIAQDTYDQVGYPEGRDGMLRIYPHRTKGEGHFMAVLEKEGELLPHIPAATGGVSKKAEKKGGKDDGMAAYQEFVRDTLHNPPEELFANSGYLQFGDQLYLKPTGVSSLAGLRVLRPGLHLGTMKKGRFEPSHALALALDPKEAKHTICLEAEETSMQQYLNGQTFPTEGDKGWYLILADGYSVGWGKLAGGMMKNHYPKGLRTP